MQVPRALPVPASLCRPPGASLCSSNGCFGYRFLLELGVEGGCGVGLCWNGIWGAAAEGCGACAAHLPPPHTHTQGGGGKPGPASPFLPLVSLLSLNLWYSPVILLGLELSPWRSLLSPHQPELTGDVMRDPLREGKQLPPWRRQRRFLSLKIMISFLRPRARASHHQAIYTFRLY